MLKFDKSSPNFEKLQELEEFLSNSKDLREWKRGQAVKLRLLGFSDQEIVWKNTMYLHNSFRLAIEKLLIEF